MTRHGSGHIYGPSTSIASKAVLAVALFLSLGSAAKAATLTLDDLSEGDLILTEVMIDPVAKEDYRAEWFEVYNNTAEDVDLLGLELTDNDLDAYTVDSSVVVAAGDYAIFAVRDDPSLNGALPTVDYVYTRAQFRFYGGDEAYISYGGLVFDGIEWGVTRELQAPSGASLQVDPAYLDADLNDSPYYWCDASSPYGLGDLGTPGEANDDCGLAALTVEDLTRGDLVISEVMINPTKADDSRAEWIEIYNNSGSRVALDGLIIEDLGTDSLTLVTGVTVDPDEYAVLAVRKSSSLNGGVTNVDVEYSRSKLRLDDGEDELILSNGAEDLDEIAWSSSTTALADGAALAVDPDKLDADSNDVDGAFCTATTSYGLGDFGTPGAVNDDCSDDEDGDGYEAGVDCDDTDPDVYPGADELCNDADDDCDDVIDNDPVDGATYNADLDEDGYGDSADHIDACSQPAGYIEDGSDCDDTDPDVNPDGVEICNDIDDDCNDLVDDDATDATTYYPDVDADTYGDDDNATLACSKPDGYITTGGDCEDTVDTVHPGATEVCQDGYDNDCDNNAGECGLRGDFDLSTADAKFIGNTTNTDAGKSVSGIGDVNGDGLDDVLIGAPSTALDDAPTSTGVAYVVYGEMSGNITLNTDADATLNGEANGDQAGYSAAPAGDLDGDGYADFLVGARDESTVATDAGAAYLVMGPVSGSSDLADAQSKLLGTNASEIAGFILAGEGDVDGDGTHDIVVGGYGDTEIGTDAGAAYVVFGTAPAGESSLDDADLKLVGEAANDRAGRWVSANGDVDADGLSDVVVGAYLSDVGGTYVDGGRGYLAFGGITGSVSLADADVLFDAESAGDEVGYTCDNGGDVSGDGYDDVLLSAVYENSVGTKNGAVYVVYGPFDGTSLVGLADADVKLVGGTANDHAGARAALIPSSTGDSLAEVFVGAFGQDDGGSSAGVGYVAYYPLSGTVTLGSSGAQFIGEVANDKAGSSLASAGDVDGDGYNDFLIGAQGEATGGANAGAAYMLLGTGW